MRPSNLTLFAVIATTLSCGDESGCSDDGCEACQAALDHMQEKVRQNDCNPNYMEDAVDQILEDCQDIDAYQAIGAIHEWCRALRGPGAPQVQCEFPSATQMDATYQMEPQWEATYPDGVVFEVLVGGTPIEDVLVEGSGFQLVVPLTAVIDGDDFEVSVFDVSDAERATPIASARAQLNIRQTAEQWDACCDETRKIIFGSTVDGLPLIRLEKF